MTAKRNRPTERQPTADDEVSKLRVNPSGDTNQQSPAPAAPASPVALGSLRVSALSSPNPSVQPAAIGIRGAENVPEQEITKAIERTMAAIDSLSEGAAEAPAPTPITSNLGKGLAGEKLAADALARAGHTIVDMKPELKGANQPGFDMLTMKDGIVYFVDNKAHQTSGLIRHVSALEYGRFEANLQGDRGEGLRSWQLIQTAVRRSVSSAAMWCSERIDRGSLCEVDDDANADATPRRHP